jgi:hypothetical protein
LGRLCEEYTNILSLEDYVRVVCVSSSLGNSLPTFRDNVVVSSSRVEMSRMASSHMVEISKNIATLEDEATAVSRSVANLLLSDEASYPRRTESSAVPIRRPENAHIMKYRNTDLFLEIRSRKVNKCELEA